ncbi:hypothetical protein AB1Y20_002832 [Prymnesium parvum]|uniref:mitogen-activated protein kinase kinase n=1 Tax=Prymnesium parvum TaxID=97485 RepID=A0AB34JC32_PRYPA
MLRRPTLEALSVGVGHHDSQSSRSSPASNPSPHSATKLSESGKFVIGGFEISREGVTATHAAAHGDGDAPLEPLLEGGEGVAADVFDELQPLEIIGRGASGFVRRAAHSDGRAVAIKDICISDPARRKQIFNEISLLRAQNPNQIRHLIQYLGVRYLEGSIQIAMEYMDAGSLGDLLQRVGPLSQDCMGAICRQTLLALDELKERHLVHRDLKPQNILLNLRGECKVSDFGCVAELQDSFGKCGTFVGTVPYMSPERINGEEYSYASDIWSLGLTVVECAQGHFPYARYAGYWGILQAVLNEPSPSLDPTQFCPELRDFAAYCLRKNPEERPSARTLLQHPFIKWYGEEEASHFRLGEFLAGAVGTRKGCNRVASAPAKAFASEANESDIAHEVEEELLFTDEDRTGEDAELLATGACTGASAWVGDDLRRGEEAEGDESALEVARLEQLSALMERNVELEGDVASARQELQALHHANAQLQLQVSSSQNLIVQLREAMNKEAKEILPAPSSFPRRAAVGASDSELMTFDARRLDRLHPVDLERLALQTERNLQDIRAALKRRGRRIASDALTACRPRPRPSSGIAVAGGRIPMSSRPSSVSSSRQGSLSQLPRPPSPPPINGRPPSERRSKFQGP